MGTHHLEIYVLVLDNTLAVLCAICSLHHNVVLIALFSSDVGSFHHLVLVTRL